MQMCECSKCYFLIFIIYLILLILYRDNMDNSIYLGFFIIFIIFCFCYNLKICYHCYKCYRERKPIIFNKNLINYLEKSNSIEMCIICLENVENGIKLPCQCIASYHKKCITEWFEYKIQCPICKTTKIFSSQKSYIPIII
jgi:hypothetical protein